MPSSARHEIDDALRQYVTRCDLAEDYDDYHRDIPLLEYDTAFLSAALEPRGDVLDVGCGTGRHLVSLFNDGHRPVGMDLSGPMLDVARAKLDSLDLRIPLVQADMRARLPFRDRSFDHVICMFSTMGLIPSAAGRSAFVQEAARVLRPGGVFVIHVHNRLYNLVAGWGRLWLLRTYTTNRFLGGLEIGDRILSRYRGVRNMYLHVFSLAEVRKLLSDNGFEVRRAVLLNDDRTGEITGPLATVRANGFIFAAARAAAAAAPAAH